MSLARVSALVICAALALPACQSSGPPTCDLTTRTQLATTTWPKFHADAANSGRADVDLSGNSGAGGILFPPAGQTIGPTETTPILGPAIIYLGSSDTNVYALEYDGQPAALEGDITMTGAITGSPLLGADGTLFVPSNGQLGQFRADGTTKNLAPLLGFDSASPNLWDGDGTAFVGTLSGGLSRVCPNGGVAYQVTFPATQSPVGITQDPNLPNQDKPIIIAAGLAGVVRAFNLAGRQLWSFFASATVNAAVLIDESTELFYVADANGRVFSGALANGVPQAGFAFLADAGIGATPALGRDSATVPALYVGDLAGNLYALDRVTGAVRWVFEADGPIGSSPAVAIGGSSDIIVFGADVLGSIPGTPGPVPIGGRVYAVRDDGSQGTLLWSFDAGSSIGASSPSIGADGTVYIGRRGQQLATGAQCPGGVGPCVINVGGGLIAIGPGAPSS
ncbi:MAG: PQQ-binding-like beta-propeller repeat protein [Candidatus Binatia bacterium]